MNGPTASLPRLTRIDTLAFLTRVVLPTFAKGLVIRRRTIVRLAARADLDGRAVREMMRLKARYGSGAARLAVPGRWQVVVLDGGEMARILAGAPEPFSPATREKCASLGHLEPRVALLSHGEERTARRRFNDDVLESGSPAHVLAPALLGVVREEAEALAAGGTFDWAAFRGAFMRAVRRMTFGDTSADDDALSADVDALRRAANWAFLRPRRQRLLSRTHARIGERMSRAGPGTLAARAANLREVQGRPPDDALTAETDQVAHWLFAFDAAAIAAIRALALLAAHPAARERAELEAGDGTAGPVLRAIILETLRLYPTTPVILRETTRDARCGAGPMPAGSHLIVFLPFFHRDDGLPEAHRFAPQIWLEGGAAWQRPFVPFSAGPAQCPARHLVPMLAGAWVGHLLARGPVVMTGGQALDHARPLPGTLDHTRLRFRLEGVCRADAAVAGDASRPCLADAPRAGAL